MATLPIYTIEGTKVGEVERPALLTVPVDVPLIHRYYTWVRTMLRETLSNTKTRGDVRGGGRKPWKQKGTGRARVGSSRSPIWRGGGVVFGPTVARNWETRMPRGERRKAMMSALSAKADANNVVILDQWVMDVPKTKTVIAMVNAIEPLKGKKVLHVHADFDATLFASTNNLPDVTSKTVQALNIIDVLNHDVIVMTKDALAAAEQHFTPSV